MMAFEAQEGERGKEGKGRDKEVGSGCETCFIEGLGSGQGLGFRDESQGVRSGL
jgi:hypothetical protein